MFAKNYPDPMDPDGMIEKSKANTPSTSFEAADINDTAFCTKPPPYGSVMFDADDISLVPELFSAKVKELLGKSPRFCYPLTPEKDPFSLN
jgi:hypothetical protein